jgi:hypothetical protein
MPLWACGWGDWVRLGMRQESLPASTPETQERQGQFPSDCEKMFFKTSSDNRASTNVFAASPSIRSRLSQDLIRTTHLVINDRFGQHCLSSESGKVAEEIQDT